MKRRDFLKGGIATGLSAVFTPAEAFAQFGQEKKYIEYYRDVCDSLDKLVDYRTGQPYELEGFAIAYFCTPYNAYPGQGCATDALNIFQSKRFAEMTLDSEIEAIMVVSPLEQGDPPPNFANSYTNPERGGNFYFTGLTGHKDKVLSTAQNYRSAFEVDRNSGNIEGHNRSAVLISPKGELLVKYSPSHLGNMYSDMVRHIQEYNDRSIRPARGCEP